LSVDAPADKVEDGVCTHVTHEEAAARNIGDGPREVPPIAVEHGHN